MSSPIDAAGYLLGELSPDARAEAERRMRADSALVREVDRLRPVLLGLEDLPTEAWERLEPPPIVLPEGSSSSAPSAFDWLRGAFAGTGMRVAAGAVAVVAALAVGFGVGVLAGGDDSPTPERTLTLAGLPEAPGAEGTAQVFAAASGTGELEVDVTGLAPSGQDEVYELWLLNSNTNGPAVTAGADCLLETSPGRLPSRMWTLATCPGARDQGHEPDSTAR